MVTDMVVSASSSAFISPSPLKRWTYGLRPGISFCLAASSFSSQAYPMCFPDVIL